MTSVLTMVVVLTVVWAAVVWISRRSAPPPVHLGESPGQLMDAVDLYWRPG